MNRLLRNLMFGLILVGTASCSSSTPQTPTPTPVPSAPTLQSVSLSASLANFTRVGATAQAIATGTFSNGTTQDLTATCTNWLSDNVGVLTVNSTGLMTAQSSGTAVVSTTCQGVVGRGSVTLNLGAPPSTTLVISGTVTDATSRGVLPNIDIQINAGTNSGRSTKTDSSGKYSLTALSSGSFTLTAAATGYVPTTQTGTLSSNTTIDFVLSRAGVSGPNGPTCSASSVPLGVTAVCTDGTFSMSQNRSGTCSSHQGVACWVCPGPLCQ